MRLINTFLLVLFVAGGCGTKRAPGRSETEAAAVFAAYIDAAVAQDREKLQALVLLPDDPERRKWVLSVIREAEPPPSGVNRLPPSVTMDGPVALGRVKSRTAGGPSEPSSPAFLVRRDGRWKVVIRRRRALSI